MNPSRTSRNKSRSILIHQQALIFQVFLFIFFTTGLTSSFTEARELACYSHFKCKRCTFCQQLMNHQRPLFLGSREEQWVQEYQDKDFVQQSKPLTLGPNEWQIATGKTSNFKKSHVFMCAAFLLFTVAILACIFKLLSWLHRIIGDENELEEDEEDSFMFSIELYAIRR